MKKIGAFPCKTHANLATKVDILLERWSLQFSKGAENAYRKVDSIFSFNYPNDSVGLALWGRLDVSNIFNNVVFWITCYNV